MANFWTNGDMEMVVADSTSNSDVSFGVRAVLLRNGLIGISLCKNGPPLICMVLQGSAPLYQWRNQIWKGPTMGGDIRSHGFETIACWIPQGNRIIPGFLRRCEKKIVHPQCYCT